MKTSIDRLALFSFALLAALWALAQTSADSANREHVIPLVADGEGIRSRLFVGNASGAVNQCSMELVGAGLDMARFGEHAAVAPNGGFATIDLSAPDAAVNLTSFGGGTFVTGYAKLSCAGPAVTRLLLSSEAGGAAVPLATIESAPSGADFALPAPPGPGSLGLVVANDSHVTASCGIVLRDGSAHPVAEGAWHIPPQGSDIRFLDDIVRVPSGFSGGSVAVSCDPDVYALGRPAGGSLFSALPAASRSDDAVSQSAGAARGVLTAATGGDDHGNAPASATVVEIPSTTAGYLDHGDPDYFRVEIGTPGTLTVETAGSTDTYGYLVNDSGRPLRLDYDGGEGRNFRIETGSGGLPELSAGVYYVLVRGFGVGAYELKVSGSASGPGALPAAAAPSVAINAIADGNEGTTATLGATLSGGTYDGAPEYAWTVSGGALDNPASATPTWTRPSVGANASYTIGLTVTVNGAGTNAQNGSSATANASQTALVRDVPAQLPVAAAPAVSIDAVPAGDENTTVQLRATLTGGTYDGAVEYDWDVSGGALDNDASATPTWTRPSVTSNTNYTVSLTVTVRGAGTNAQNGSSATANASRSAQVRDVPAQLPVAAAPTVSIDAVPAGDENTAVQLSASLTGGTYDGTPEYAWSVSGGALNDSTLAAPTWTRPSVSADGDYTVSLTVTVNGAGTVARNGTSATADAPDRTAQVRDTATTPPPPTSCVDDAKWGTVADYYDHNANRSPNYGANWYRVLIAYRVEDPERTLPAWEGATARPTTAYTAYEATTGETVWSGWTPVREVLDCLEAAQPAAAVAPTVTIDAIAAGDENTAAPLGATLTGGTYDGAVEYDWDVSGGALDNDASATPTWTRPSVAADANFTVSLTVTVRGTGANAQNGSSATANAPDRTAQVRDVPPQLPAAAAPTVSIDAVAAGDENTSVQLGASLAGGTYDGAAEYDWDVSGGALDNDASATPTWTRPSVAADANFTVSLTVTVRGSGANAQSGTSATTDAPDRTAQVRDNPPPPPTSCVSDTQWQTVADYYDANKNRSPNYGANWYRVLIAYQREESGKALPAWVGSTTQPTAAYTAAEAALSENVWSGWTPVREVLDCLEKPPALPAAAAPAVAIDAIAAGDENTAAQLSATLTGGTYDGTPEYAWSVSGGDLDDDASAAPTWTRPSVNADGDYTISLAVTVHGAGTAARNGTSAAANASLDARVRDVPAQLPAAAAPTVSIDAIAAGDENTSVQLGASLAGGTYDGAVEYDWDVSGGDLDDDTSAAPTWTRPAVSSNTDHTVSLTVTVRGAGTAARNGTSDSANAADRTAQVRDVGGGGNGGDHGDNQASATPVGIPSTTSGSIAIGDRDYFRIDVTQSGSLTLATTGGTDTVGYLYDGNGTQVGFNDDGGEGRNFRIFRGSIPVGTYYLMVRGYYHSSTEGDYTLSLTGSASGGTGTALPAAAAPSVAIGAIAAGDENTAVQLSATLTGGAYDGAAEYAWSVSGGDLDDDASAAPTWTRPSVNADGDYTISLAVTVHGADTAARNGTSATANASLHARVRDVPAQLPAAAAPTVSIDAVAAGDENTAVQLSATLSGGTYDGAVEYDWTVSGGALSSTSSATPTWTLPAVSSHTDYTLGLTVTARGAGALARDNTSDTASHNVSVTVRDTPAITVATLVSGLSIPWDIAFTPDGTMLFTERAGKLSSRLADGTVQTVTADFGDVFNQFESGLMAIAVDPDFATNRRFYTCQAHTGPEVQVIAWTIDSGYAAATRVADPLVGGIPASSGGRHSGCRLRFGPDGFLWIATGDAATGTAPQDLNSLGGKVLRVNASTGAGATGNPLSSAPRIYSYGHRNPQGLALRPGTRQMWLVEHGPTRDDEINLLAAGGNYGWDPVHAGDPNDPYFEGVPMTFLQRYPNAIAAKWSSGSSTLAVSGGVFLEGDRWGAWEGRLAVASLKDQSLRLFEFGSGGDLLSEVNLAQLHRAHGRLRTPMLGPDGALYLTTSNGSGDRILRIAPPATTPADAPVVSIDAVADGDENTAVQLGATLTGGTYDGAVEYDWDVSGGDLDDDTSAAPTWTRPSVSSNANHTVSLTITVRGDGTVARNGSSDTGNASRQALVRDAAVQLPLPTAPSVSIDAIPLGTEETGVRLRATLAGGNYDGAAEYEWSVTGGTLDDVTSATPKWTRPAVTSNTSYTVSLTVTVRGTGAKARDNQQATANASRTAQVRDTGSDHGNAQASATQVAIPSITAGRFSSPSDVDYFRIEVRRAGTLVLQTTGFQDTIGSLFDSNGRSLASDHNSGADSNFRITRPSASAGVYYLRVTPQYYTGDGAYSLSVAGAANDDEGAGAPLATIDSIDPGDAGATVGLSAALTGGNYDGAPEYFWSVSGGALDDDTSATPTWTRPAVTANTDATVSLTVTVRGTGGNAPSGSSDSYTATRTAFVRAPNGDHGNTWQQAWPITDDSTTPGRITPGDRDYFRFTLASEKIVSIETTGSTDTEGLLLDQYIEERGDDDDFGDEKNFRIVRTLEAGTYYVGIRGYYQHSTAGAYNLVVEEYSNSAPTVDANEAPGAQQAIAGGAPLVWVDPTSAFSDRDGEDVWLEPSSSNESVATVALEGLTLVVYPHAAGTATVTATARDAEGASAAASFTVTVSAPAAAAPTAAFNSAGDTLTLSFSDSFAAGETRAYQAWVRQTSYRPNWRKFCATTTHAGTTAQTKNVSLNVPLGVYAEPGVEYEAIYQHVGGSCPGNLNGQWSAAVKATTPGTSSFDIDVVYIGSIADAHRAIVEAAVAKWEQIITASLPNVDFSRQPRGADNCMSGSPALNDVVDDLRLYVKIQSRDGPGGTLASAGACLLRGPSLMPIVGTVNIDAADMARLSAERGKALMIHEIAHALGFSNRFWRRASLMRQRSLLANGEDAFTPIDTHFAGPLARAEFDKAGGSSYTENKVPVENNLGGAGTRDSHWRESVMDNELMTGFIDAGDNPLSAISIQAMADLGYQVDVSQADAYRLPGSGGNGLRSDSSRQGISDSDSHEHHDEQPIDIVLQDSEVYEETGDIVVLPAGSARTAPAGSQ